jgi:hypothetical protein
MDIDHEKLMKMFHEVEGDLGSSCLAYVHEPETWDEDYALGICVIVIKDHEECWRKSLAEITFSYITRDW